MGASPAESSETVASTNAPAVLASRPTHEFTVPLERQQQIGVTYDTVCRQKFKYNVQAAGTVAYDRQRYWEYVARVDGYVENLFISSRGEPVAKDAPLLVLYSPDLYTAQNEFVGILKRRDQLLKSQNQQELESLRLLVDSAKARLRLWNITDDQITALEQSRKPQMRLTLKSPMAGIIQALDIDQGRRVMPGQRLVAIADLSQVWIWAQFYESEMALLKKDIPVTITASAYPSEHFSGKISLIDPFLDPALRTERVRVDVNNPALRLRPDMYVNVELGIDGGEGLGIPIPAVLPTGQHNIVFVNQGEGKLEPRFVELGREYGRYYQVLSGLREGERVVTSANFLIDAEAKVQGALPMWSTSSRGEEP